MAAEESSHARLFQAIGERTAGLSGGAVARLEGRHRAGGGNALRAAVLGANDGLVSNASLVMGVAGAELGGPVDPDHRPGRVARRLAVDGAWRMALRSELPGTLRTPDRHRAPRAPGGAGRRSRGAGAHLSGKGTLAGSGAGSWTAARAGPAGCTRYARSGGARGRSRSARRLRLGGCYHILSPLFGRGDYSRRTLFLWRGNGGAAGKSAAQRHRSLCDRRRDHDHYRPQRASAPVSDRCSSA